MAGAAPSTASATKAKTRSYFRRLAGYYLWFTLCFALFLGAIYSLSFLSLGNPWPMAVCLGLFALAFWLPQTIFGRSDSAGEH